MRTLLALTLLWGALAPHILCAADDDLVEVPPSAPASWKEYKVPVGRILTLQSKAAGKWIGVDAGLEIAPCGDGKSVNFSAPVAAKYRAVFISGETVKLVMIVVGDPAPTPPGPNPPVPPDTPTKLVTDLRAAMKQDAASSDDIKLLAELIGTMVNESKDDAYVTAKQLNDTYKLTRDRLLKNKDGSIRCPATRARIGQEIGAIVDDETAILTPDVRQKLADTYALVLDALTKAQKL